MPRTTEAFENVLQAFKDQDPNGNGIADEIPMMGDASTNPPEGNIAGYLLNSFIYTVVEGDTPYFYVEDGMVRFMGDKDEYKQGAAWINSLVDKGLIDATSFTQDIEQHKQVSLQGDVSVVGVEKCDIGYKVLGKYDQTPDHRVADYKVLPPLTGPNGFCVQPSNVYKPISQGNFVITSSCKNPEAAFRWADAWYSEEATFLSWHGEEGKGWEKPAEGAVGINGKSALYKSLPDNYKDPEQLIRVTNRFGNNTAVIREGEELDINDPNSVYGPEPVLYEGAMTLKEYAKPEMTLPPLALTKEEIEETMSIKSAITEYTAENMSLFCLGTRDIEKDWDSYVKEFSVMGLDKLIEVYQTAYDRQYK